MKQIITVEWQCEICKECYKTKAEAEECEAMFVEGGKRGVKIGDSVYVKSGQGSGEFCTVDKTYVVQRSYCGDRYWHTLAVRIKFPDKSVRNLMLDEYLTREEYEKCYS
jgi:hypothetical protein